MDFLAATALEPPTRPAASPLHPRPESRPDDETELPRRTAPVIGVPIDVLDWQTAIRRIGRWGAAHESRYVCICNVHSVVTAAFDADFGRVASEADMATCDGAPVTWMLRQLGAPMQRRINGPDLMWRYCAAFAPRGARLYLYGGKPSTLDLLAERLRNEFPGLQLAGVWSPPFRALTDAELAEDARRINESGANVVFVGLGCPKQELWMARQRGHVRAVMIGVGAAFDYHAGTVTRAPEWMQHRGLEWLYRLSREPRRLWKRYMLTNAVFIALASGQWLASRFSGARPAAEPPRPGQAYWHSSFGGDMANDDK